MSEPTPITLEPTGSYVGVSTPTASRPQRLCKLRYQGLEKTLAKPLVVDDGTGNYDKLELQYGVDRKYIIFNFESRLVFRLNNRFEMIEVERNGPPFVLDTEVMFVDNE
jgi:hypothetical protein